MKDKEELLLEKAGEEGNADAKYKKKSRYRHLVRKCLLIIVWV